MDFIDSFVESKSPKAAAKARTVLNKKLLFSGVRKSRADVIRESINLGDRVKRFQIYNFKLQEQTENECWRLGRNAPTGNENHPQTIRLRELQHKLKKNDFYEGCRMLVGIDGASYSNKALTKTGVDFAEFIINTLVSTPPTSDLSFNPADLTNS